MLLFPELLFQFFVLLESEQLNEFVEFICHPVGDLLRSQVVDL